MYVYMYIYIYTRPDKICVILVPFAAAQKILGATARCTEPAMNMAMAKKCVF